MGVCVCSRGVCVVGVCMAGGICGGGCMAGGGMHDGGHAPPSNTMRYSLVVMHSRAVRILLECILLTNNVDGHHQEV